MQYAFILGHQPHISLAEIKQALTSLDRIFKVVSFWENVVIIETKSLSIQFFERLGGAVKMAEVTRCPVKERKNMIAKMIKARAGKNKLKFAISAYGSKVRHKDYEKIGLIIKKELTKSGVSSRYVSSKEKQLSAVVIRKQKLTDSGIEVVAVEDDNKLWIGRTVAVQDFEGFSFRDYKRPAYDDFSGMLPPKLARIMINLAGVKLGEQTVLLDPFCGSGTVLMEAALLGAGQILGSDVSGKAVKDSLANTSWLRKKYAVYGKFVIEQFDVLDIDTWLAKDYVDLVVTEPYLGEPVKGNLSDAGIKMRQLKLTELYNKALIKLSKVVKPRGKIVMVLPYIKQHHISLAPQVFELFNKVEFNEELLYKRPDQHVGRKIIVLEKVA